METGRRCVVELHENESPLGAGRLGIKNMIDHFGKYKIESRLGEGGMGAVYKAFDTALERTVALKTILPGLAANEEVKSRLLREAKAAAKLQHPNVVTIYEFGEIDSQLYIAMEYLRGKSLREALGKPLPVERKIEIVVQTLRALEYAHRHGIVHRDVKPSNIHICDDGTVKLLDFGIAHLAGSDLTRTGTSMGTPEYMSPEMVEGAEIDARSDIFSCGVVLYEMLTSTKPFKHERVTTTLFNIVRFDPPPLSHSLPQAPSALDRIAARMMAKNPDERYQNLTEAISDLEQVLTETFLAKASKAKEMADLAQEIERDIQKASADKIAKRMIEGTFQTELERMRERVPRMSKASDTSISLEMIEATLDELTILHTKVRLYIDSELGSRMQAVHEPTEIVGNDLQPAPAEADEGVPLEEAVEEAPPAAEIVEETVRHDAPPAPAAAPGGKRNLILIAAAALAVVLVIVIIVVMMPTGDGPETAQQQEGEIVPQEEEAGTSAAADDDAAATETAEPDDPETLGRRLDQAFRRGNAREIANLVTRLEGLGPLTTQQQYYKAWAQVRRQRFTQAQTTLKAVLESDPDDASAQLLMGLSAWRASKENDPALEHLFRSLALGKLSADEQTLARDTVLEMTHSFTADHEHPRRLGVFGGGDCSGTLTISKDGLAYRSEQQPKHNADVALNAIESISVDKAQNQLEIKPQDLAFKLKTPADLDRASRLFTLAFGFQSSEEGGATVLKK